MRKRKGSNRTRFFPGNQRPAANISKNKMFYEMKLSKYKGKMRWLVIEKPTGSILCASAFQDEAKRVADFQNKHKQWVPQGGVVKHLTLGKL
tara:strand:- start:4457 stop:4732 length:276 start_codon:yes stop_codon:yes gene_type:complete